MMSKHQARQEALRARRSMSAEQIAALSLRVHRNLEVLSEYSDASVVASYMAKGDEVQTKGIVESALASGRRVLIPRTDPARMSLTFHEVHSLGELKPGNFGILEPSAESRMTPLSEAQIVLVPVVAWDGSGGRLGYGKGYFDRELRSRGKAVAAGLAFESQRRPSLPVTQLDVPLDLIVTERRVLRFGRATRA